MRVLDERGDVLAVGVNAVQINPVTASRRVRTAKYNRLLRIESDLGDDARFLGKDAFRL